MVFLQKATIGAYFRSFSRGIKVGRILETPKLTKIPIGHFRVSYKNSVGGGFRKNIIVRHEKAESVVTMGLYYEN
jgi:hypothetical protein